MKTRLFAVLTTLTLAFSCNNEIEINAPYKDVAAIYAFLDQNEPVQYIRIGKLYQNSPNQTTNQGTQISDSLYFDSLIVKLIDISTQIVYPCYKVDTIPKNPGFFSNAKNTLYACVIPKNNAIDNTYRLEVSLPGKEIKFTSTTTLVKDATIESRKIVINTEKNTIIAYRVKPGKYAVLYDLSIRMWYKEMEKSDTNNYSLKFADYAFRTSYPSSLLNNDPYTTVTVASDELLANLKKSILADDSKVRRFEAINFLAYGGSSQFQEMQQVTAPNLSIVQKKPEFSNIENGLGIFTSRNLVIQPNIIVDAQSIPYIVAALPNFIE